MKVREKFDYEELCILIPIMRRPSKAYIQSELEKMEAGGIEEDILLKNLKEKIDDMEEDDLKKLFDEHLHEAF